MPGLRVGQRLVPTQAVNVMIVLPVVLRCARSMCACYTGSGLS